ncbi:hypothetical protein HHI36_015187 [Cryptolaemus montrouzieri]|uniref:Uncharacterized protein n=1 Tax=Cryptolaemus montrouzieri TaxID=559131 RepID=A0ABD2N4Z4_9CUCU
MRDCPTKPANRMKLIRQQNDPTNPNTPGATFVQVLTKEIVPGNETEPEIIKENVNYSNAGNMEENENNMGNMDTQNATTIENSQEPESSADDVKPKIDSITEQLKKRKTRTKDVGNLKKRALVKKKKLRRWETTEELTAGDINEKNEETNIEKLASAVSIHVCNNTTTNCSQQVGPPSKKDQFLK